MKSGPIHSAEIGLGLDQRSNPGNGEPSGYGSATTAFTSEGSIPILIGSPQEQRRLKAQPYKAMIYPNVDSKTGRRPQQLHIGWEYTANDDFQDVVTRSTTCGCCPRPRCPAIVEARAESQTRGRLRIHRGPRLGHEAQALYFSDIPPAHIVRYKDGKAEVANAASNQSERPDVRQVRRHA